MANQRVVLVDDDGVCLAMLARGLRRRGYEVASFSDPREAVRALDQRPAAVITDMRMPHLTGLDVVARVAELGKDAPPVLVVSADGDEALLNEAFRLGAADYLLKPVSDAELGAKLEKALRARPTHAGPPAIPDRIGGWQLGECIGRGGTACVFRATREGDATSFALKVIWPHLTQNTETLLRFRREIDTLSALSHPGMIRFVESGRQDDAWFYVMDYLEGGTLRDRIEADGPRSPAETLDLLDQVLEPLVHLHERGVVHRDVKPSNLFYGAQGFMLGDFGLARRLGDHGITLEEDFIGTPLYLAPEVFRSRDFDHSVDTYALGVCAVEALAGAPVLSEAEPMLLIGRIMERGLPHPRDVLGGAVPAPLLDLLAQLTDFDPARRLKDPAKIRAAVQSLRAQ
ncbi:MAG: protein kinase [Planctomycetota bacterium]